MQTAVRLKFGPVRSSLEVGKRDGQDSRDAQQLFGWVVVGWKSAKRLTTFPFPAECWTAHKRRYGHLPLAIDVLNLLS